MKNLSHPAHNEEFSLSKNTVTVQDLADQFAQLDAGEGWAFAAIVACGVEKGVGSIPKGVSTATTSDCGKVSAKKFSAMAGTTIDRIGRFLNAWDYAATQGFCVASSTLCPGSLSTVVYPNELWAEVYAASNAANKTWEPVEDSSAVRAESERQADAARAAENAKRIAHLERQAALTKAQYEQTLAEQAIKAQRMADQQALVAERNATAKAEAIAKEEARRKHRAAEDAKAAAVVVAAAKERQAMVAEQKARKDAEAAAEAAARAEADAEREAAATSTLADFNEAVEQALTWLAEAKATGLKVSAMQESQLKRAVESIVPNGQLVRR